MEEKKVASPFARKAAKPSERRILSPEKTKEVALSSGYMRPEEFPADPVPPSTPVTAPSKTSKAPAKKEAVTVKRRKSRSKTPMVKFGTTIPVPVNNRIYEYADRHEITLREFLERALEFMETKDAAAKTGG